RIVIDDLTGPEIAALLEAHTAELRSLSPPESKHAFDIEQLRRPEITMWSVWDGDTLVGCGALHDLGDGHAELKSMRVIASHTGRGIASMLLTHILDDARTRGFARVSLETGSMPFFEPAHRLYRKHGFEPCGPFGTYTDDPNSVFMTKQL
ncbi:MAG TPA: GNAT family N-acetyltransferase, partial [Thermomicrobiales bacterium]|nr:GNAT family N-acetyltransferase [Thermomicrobiales bacterium]